MLPWERPWIETIKIRKCTIFQPHCDTVPMISPLEALVVESACTRHWPAEAQEPQERGMTRMLLAPHRCRQVQQRQRCRKRKESFFFAHAEIQSRRCIELFFCYCCLRPYSRLCEIKHFGPDAQKMDLLLTPPSIQNTIISPAPPQKRDERTM